MSLHKRKLLEDLFEIVDRTYEGASFHQREIESLKLFVEKSIVMFESEAPEFKGKFKAMMDIISEIIGEEQKIQQAEHRVAEDLNDIAARFDIVFRTSEETMEKTSNVKRASARIAELREKLQADISKGGAKQVAIEQEITNAIEAKKKAVEEADVKLQEFIAVKQRYNKFKVRRMRNAYSNFGEVTKNSNAKMASLYEQLANEARMSDEELNALLETHTE